MKVLVLYTTMKIKQGGVRANDSMCQTGMVRESLCEEGTLKNKPE